MCVNIDNCLTLTFLITVLSASVSQTQPVNSCSVVSRPHPQGICGPRLARAHANLCFLLRRAYPDYFSASGGKRSVDNSIIDRIYNIPLSVLAEVDVNNDNWGSFINKRDFPKHLLPSPVSREAAYEGQAQLSDFNGVTGELFRMLQKRGAYIERRSGSNMVCDCCYNVCTPRQLATYC